MLLWLRYPAFDDIREALKASIAPEPGTERKISANRRANTACAVTPGAGCPGNFAVKDLLAKRDLVARCSWRYRQAGIGVNAFRRHSFMRSLGFDRRSGRGLNFCHVRVKPCGCRKVSCLISSNLPALVIALIALLVGLLPLLVFPL